MKIYQKMMEWVRVKHIRSLLHTPTPRENRLATIAVLVMAALIVMPEIAYADSGMPWDSVICKIAASFRGPVAKGGAMIAGVICGLMMAFGEMSGFFKTLLSLVIGCCLALLSADWIGSMTTGGTLTCG